MVDVEPVPQWMRPIGGFTALDLDHLPELPRHTELIDGALVLVGPQSQGHVRLVTELHLALGQASPPELGAIRDMSIIVNDRQRPEPDVTVLDAAVLDDDATWFPAKAVLLAVEVVSPESQVRDRVRKPQLYAEAGIKHFWRVEHTDGEPVVYVYELDPATSTYALSGIHHDRLTLTIPFPIDIDLAL